MSTRRIYLEGLKETDENADKKIYAGNNYSGYNRVSIRRKRSLYWRSYLLVFFLLSWFWDLARFTEVVLWVHMTMQRIIQSDINIIKAFRFIVETPCGISPKKICQMIMSRLMIILQKWKRLTNFLLIKFRTVSIWWFHIIVIINSLVFFKTEQIWYICWKGLYIIYSPTAMNEK